MSSYCFISYTVNSVRAEGYIMYTFILFYLYFWLLDKWILRMYRTPLLGSRGQDSEILFSSRVQMQDLEINDSYKVNIFPFLTIRNICWLYMNVFFVGYYYIVNIILNWCLGINKNLLIVFGIYCQIYTHITKNMLF